MTRDEIIEYCLTFPFAYEDYPFDDVVDDNAWTLIRHKGNKKSFAMIYNRNGKISINLKCDPVEAGIIRQVYSDVTAAYHMNKEHWNTLYLGGDVPDQELFDMIQRSYDLIKPKARVNTRLKADKKELADNETGRKPWTNCAG